MRLSIMHTTRYQFDAPLIHGLQRLRLTPKETQGQTVAEWAMDYQGGHEQLSFDDQNFNHTTVIAVDEGVQELVITCRGTVDTVDNCGVLGRHAGMLPLWSFLGDTRLTAQTGKIRQLALSASRHDDSIIGVLHSLSALIRDRMAYTVGVTGVSTTADEALSLGAGVCQDHAHVFITAARAMDIPARYVSGYLMMNDRVVQDASHAWAEAWIEELGWVGFDVSNGISPDERYVRVATGRDYRDAAPITGISYGGNRQEMEVVLKVEQQTAEQ